MNHLVQQGKKAEVLVALPRDLRPEALKVSLYAPTSVAKWEDQVLQPVAFELTAEAAADDRELQVDWGAGRVLEEAAGAFLVPAADQDRAPREPVVVEYVQGDRVALRETLNFTWPVGALLVPRMVRVPLSAADTADLGRCYRLELEATFADLPEEAATERATELVDVVLHVPQNSLTWDRLQALSPRAFAEVATQLGAERARMEAMRRRAFEEVLRDVSSKVPVDRIISDNDLEPVTLARLKWLFAEEGMYQRSARDPLGVIESYRAQYNETLESTLQHLSWVDRNANRKPEAEEQRASVLPRIRFDI